MIPLLEPNAAAMTLLLLDSSFCSLSEKLLKHSLKATFPITETKIIYQTSEFSLCHIFFETFISYLPGSAGLDKVKSHHVPILLFFLSIV